MKKWYQSRTIWVNVIGLIAMVLQNKYGFILDASAQTAILLLLNIFLRFDTTQSIG